MVKRPSIKPDDLQRRKRLLNVKHSRSFSEDTELSTSSSSDDEISLSLWTSSTKKCSSSGRTSKRTMKQGRISSTLRCDEDSPEGLTATPLSSNTSLAYNEAFGELAIKCVLLHTSGDSCIARPPTTALLLRNNTITCRQSSWRTTAFGKVIAFPTDISLVRINERTPDIDCIVTQLENIYGFSKRGTKPDILYFDGDGDSILVNDANSLSYALQDWRRQLPERNVSMKLHVWERKRRPQIPAIVLPPHVV